MFFPKKILFSILLFILFAFCLGFFAFGASQSEQVKVTAQVPEETAPPEKPFLILNVAVSNITSESATITWETDKPATTDLKYGREENKYKLGGIFNTDFKYKHKVILTELSPGIIYYFQISAKDKDGQEAISEEYSFATIPFFTIPVWQRLSGTEKIAVGVIFILLIIVIGFLLWRAAKSRT